MNNKILRRMLWLIYSSANTRLNLMIDECAHLQETVYAYLPSDDAIKLGLHEHRIRGDISQRAWFSADTAKMRANAYHLRTPQERSLLNLWIAMGTLAYALEKNQQELRSLFRTAVASIQAKESEAIYWFTALRGHLLHIVIPKYLSHIQHAHEKLVQLLENMPGVLPGPTLMRRWSSGGYGEFLSEFSRHVNWKVQDLYWRFCGDGSQEFETWRSNQFLVHAWSHFSTSKTRMNEVTLPGERKSPVSVITIWSSYFYLDQPILFPLLYHECAHHYLGSQGAIKLENSDDEEADVRGRRALWQDRSKETAELLNRIAPSEAPDQNFWLFYVEEIWADAISIALSGDGFLTALALQLIGLVGGDKNYSDYNTDTDEQIPIDQIGTIGQRIRAIQYPMADQAYYWEARLRLAIRVHHELFGKGGNQGLAGYTSHPWSQGICYLLDAWEESGKTVMSKQNTSQEHATIWTQRCKLNKWVENTIWAHLCDFVVALKEFDKENPPGKDDDYKLDDDIVKILLESDYSISHRGYKLKPANKRLAPNHGKSILLSDICTYLRWEWSEYIESHLETDLERSAHETKWSEVYADYLPNDGGVEFRIGLEWIFTLRDVVKAAARVFDEVNHQNKKLEDILIDHSTSEKEFINRIWAALQSDLNKYHGYPYDDIVKKLSRRPFIVNNGQWPSLSEQVNEIKKILSTHLQKALAKESPLAGTFTLGVVRPEHFKRSRGYSRGLGRVKKKIEKISSMRLNRLQLGGFLGNLEKPHFMPLFGDYTFAAYQEGFTPVEKDIHIRLPAPCIKKSRSVLRMKQYAGPTHNASLVRVSQVGFTFRWQWVLLAEKITNADIYISSAWEDIILVTYYSDLEEHEHTAAKHALNHRSWQDIHSSFGLAQLPPMQHRETHNNGCKDFASAFDGTDLAHVYERTGRYDFIIEWIAKDIPGLLDAHDKLPYSVWGKMESIVTSASKLARSRKSEHRLISNVILRHHR